MNWIFAGAIMIGVGISRLVREHRERKEKQSPLNVAGTAQGAAGGDVADERALQQPTSDLGRERPAASPKDRDTADHAAGPALPEPQKADA